jgi:hypothetical protein
MSQKTIKVRVVAMEEDVEQEANEIVDDYEDRGFECIEWSRAFPCKPPEADKAIIYLTFVRGN